MFFALISLYSSMTCIHIAPELQSALLVEGTKIESPLHSVSIPGGVGEILEPVGAALEKTGRSLSDPVSEIFIDTTPSGEEQSTGGENDYILQHSGKSLKVIQYEVDQPRFVKGIYLSNPTANSREKLVQFIEKARVYGLNTLVVDVQKSMIPREHVELIKKAGIYPVARVVVFQGGLKQQQPDEQYINQILNTIEAAAYQGFMEVQLDYIRYADDPELLKLSLTYKYEVINKILKKARTVANSLSIYLSADVFGRVTLNQNDHIGQKLENFARYMDTIYPMLYPSHYTNDPYRIGNPYETIKEGVGNSLQRCNDQRVVAYIQGFSMKIESSGLSLTDYIKAQIVAVDDAGGHGWVIWNARNDYKESFDAIKNYNQERQMALVRPGGSEKAGIDDKI